MNKLLITVSVLGLPMLCAQAGTDESTIWSNVVPGTLDSGWMVSIPTGSSDYFSVRYAAVATPNVEGGTVSKALPIRGVGISTADYGTADTYPTVGVFRPNVGLDGTGNTPDLSLPIATSLEGYAGSLPLFTYQDFDTTAEGSIPAGDATTLAVVQLPPGDSGLLGVGGYGHATVSDTSSLTQDGYLTPAVPLSFVDLGIAVGQDNSVTSSCKSADRAPHGRLRCQKLTGAGVMAGDRLTTRVFDGDILNVSFFGTRPGDQFRLYFNVSPCSPVIPLGPVLNTVPDSDGDGSFLRINATFPAGFAGNTFRFSAVWGNSACLDPGAGFTNCVTVITGLDWEGGVVDDCTIESGWVVQFPTGPSDYFNNSFGPASSGLNGVVGLTIAVLDFVTATPAYPTTGISTANTTVDPSGNTPHLTGSGVLAQVSPFTFPSGTFATSCSQYVSHPVSVPAALLTGPSIHAWVQFPPGDSGLLGVGADSSSPSAGASFYTLDGYSTPAISFFVNWGIRIRTN